MSHMLCLTKCVGISWGVLDAFGGIRVPLASKYSVRPYCGGAWGFILEGSWGLVTTYSWAYVTTLLVLGVSNTTPVGEAVSGVIDPVISSH